MRYLRDFRSQFKLKNFINYIVIALLTALFGTLSCVGVLEMSTQVLFEKFAYTLIMAVSLSLVVGFLGELSLGHAAFMSIGAYLGGYFQTYVIGELNGNMPLLGIIIAMLVGGLAAGVFGFIIGLPALKLKGDYLAIVTLAFGEIVKTVFTNSETFGAATGLKTYRYSMDTLFIIGFVALLVILAVIQNLVKSRYGREITAVRDNEIAAKSMGVNVTRIKIFVFTLSAVFAGIAGAIFSNSQFNFKSSTFDYNYSIDLLVMVVLGGMGSLNGSMIAAIVITVLKTELTFILPGNLAALQNVAFALILILVVVFNNSPKFKPIREKAFGWARGLTEKLWSKIPHKNGDKGESDKGDHADWTEIPSKIKMDALLSTDMLPPDIVGAPEKTDKGEKQ